jgi:hypothetical protein
MAAAMSANDRQMWIAILAKLVAPMEPIAAAKAMQPMLAMLAGYPDQAFTPSSAQHVALTGRIMPDGSTAPLNRVPTYGELDTALGKWWRAKREMLAVLGQPIARAAIQAPDPEEREGMNPEAREHVRAVVQAFAAERTFNQPSTSPNRVAVKAAPVSDGMLAAMWERESANGNTGAQVRIEMLRRKIGTA